MVASTFEGPIVVVIGATGSQGGSVITHLSRSDKPYRLRAVTRDASKPKAKDLEAAGCEVVEADIGKREDLDKVFAGADIVFAVTNFWEHMSAVRELEDGKRLVDAAKGAGTVKLFIWSGVESVRKGSQGKLREVAHFDAKADITEYALVSGLPIANVQAGCYMHNFTGTNFKPSRNPSTGELEFALPISEKTNMSLLDVVSDYGAFVRAAIELGGGKPLEVLGCSEEKTVREMVNEFNEVTGSNAQFRQLTPPQFLELVPGQIGVEMLEMLQWFEQYGYYNGKDVVPSQKAASGLGGVKLTPWKDFVKANFKEGDF
ncbi:hypothetical protein JCM6882_002557 [Rhodosporidiobolus microsporus]